MTTRLLTVLLLCLPMTLVAEPNAKDQIVDLPGYAFKYSVTTTASKETIWQLWYDVENWKSFDERLIYSYLEDGYEFENGAIGYLKGKGTPSRTKFELKNIQPGVSFEEELKLPLYQTVLLKRYFEPSEDSTTTFTHEVVFQGSLAWLFTLFLEGPFKGDIILVMNKMRELAESKQDSDQDSKNL
ncbi:SRPBCC family protein [Sessilibacter sp. MAH2]